MQQTDPRAWQAEDEVFVTFHQSDGSLGGIPVRGKPRKIGIRVEANPTGGSSFVFALPASAEVFAAATA